MFGESLGPGLDLAVDLVPGKIVDPVARELAPQKGGDKDSCDNDSQHLKAKGLTLFAIQFFLPVDGFGTSFFFWSAFSSITKVPYRNLRFVATLARSLLSYFD
jgi:hypothetical protein